MLDNKTWENIIKKCVLRASRENLVNFSTQQQVTLKNVFETNFETISFNKSFEKNVQKIIEKSVVY